jgi:hypothetical protein
LQPARYPDARRDRKRRRAKGIPAAGPRRRADSRCPGRRRNVGNQDPASAPRRAGDTAADLHGQLCQADPGMRHPGRRLGRQHVLPRPVHRRQQAGFGALPADTETGTTDRPFVPREQPGVGGVHERQDRGARGACRAGRALPGKRPGLRGAALQRGRAIATCTATFRP